MSHHPQQEDMSPARQALRDAQARADAETRERLLAADGELARVRAEMDEARAALSRAVGLAVEDGWSLVRIAETLGISRQRVGQLRSGDGE